MFSKVKLSQHIRKINNNQQLLLTNESSVNLSSMAVWPRLFTIDNCTECKT